VLQGDARLLAPDETPEVEALERRRQETLGRVRAALLDGKGGAGAGAGAGTGGGGGREGRRGREEDGVGGGGGSEGGGEDEDGGDDEEGEAGAQAAGDGGRAGARDAVAERKAIIREKQSETLHKGIGRCVAAVVVAAWLLFWEGGWVC